MSLMMQMIVWEAAIAGTWCVYLDMLSQQIVKTLYGVIILTLICSAFTLIALANLIQLHSHG